MKKLTILLTALLFVVTGILAQTPDQFKYQAVLRNADGTIMADESVNVYIDILQGSAGGTSVFNETHNLTTTAQGLINLNIGSTEDLSVINWGTDIYFVEITVNGTVMGASQLLSVPYALHAKTAESITGGTYEIGDFAHGGIVFWLDETGEHGLVCAKNNQDGGSGIRWYAGTHGITRATGDGPFSGEMNTAIIISSQISIGDDGNDYAAQICNDLQITEGGKTYGDWYLPAIAELDSMYQNKSIIDATAAANGGGALNNHSYWSSTEDDFQGAWIQSFAYPGWNGYSSKTNSNRVRAIRAF